MADKYSLLVNILFPYTALNEKLLRAKLEHKTILITGASFGIGEALANMLAQSGAFLILVGRTTEKLNLVKEAILAKGGHATIFTADLRNPEELEKLILFIKTQENGIDIFVNNAGKSIRRSIMESLDRFHDFTRTMAINYMAPVQLSLSLIPILRQRHGHIINISAINVLLAPAPKWAAYQASKAAFDNWFMCVAPELNASKVATTSIYLPLVKTRMIEPTTSYKNMPAMKPEHVARIICKYMITRKRTHKPWWLFFIEILSLFLRRFWERSVTKQMEKEQHVAGY